MELDRNGGDQRKEVVATIEKEGGEKRIEYT